MAKMTEDGLAEGMMAAWKAGTLREFFMQHFPHLGPAARTAWINELKARLDVPDEVAGREYRKQQVQQLIDHYQAGTLREFFKEQHPDWSDEKIEDQAAKIEAYFDENGIE
jgi:hypothetical protein